MGNNFKKKIASCLIIIICLEMIPVNNKMSIFQTSYGDENIRTDSNANYEEENKEKEVIPEKSRLEIETYETEESEFETNLSGILLKYSGPGGDIIIPKEITSIGDNVFQGRSDLTSITIIGEVHGIGQSAFEDCTNLTEISMDYSNLTYIGRNAFKNCSNLSSVSFLDNIITIDDNAFEGCSSIASIHLSNCSEIGFEAFRDCVQVKDVFISDMINKIGTGAFMGCVGLKYVTLPQNTGYLILGKSIFKDCISLVDVNIPNTISEIAENTFYNCYSLKRIVIPDNIKTIRENAFYGCENLSDITLPEQMDYLGSAFGNCKSLTNITLPKGISTIQDYCFSDCSSLTEIVIPDWIINIKQFAFTGCTSLSNVILPNEMVSIGYCAFSNTNIKSVTIPKGITSVQGFSGCARLAEVIIQDGAIEIGPDAFERCSDLKKVEIPDSVQHIRYHAFANCTNLQNVKLPESIIDIEDSAFKNNLNLHITIPSSVTKISPTAFYIEGNQTILGGENNLTIYVFHGSYAESYAKEKNIPYIIMEDIIRKNNIYIFSKWDDMQQVPYFTDLNGIIAINDYQITSNTDMSFLDSLDTLIGNPVLVQMDADNNILSIRPAEKKIGTITALDSVSVVIDGVSYTSSIASDWVAPSMYIGKTCVAYVCEDQLGTLKVAEEKSGRFDRLDVGENEIVIDSVTYTMDLKDLSFLASVDLWLGKTIRFESIDGIVYRVLTEDYETKSVKKVKSFDVGTKTVYFEDGSLNVLADENSLSPEDHIGKWTICTLYTSITQGVVLTDMVELSSTISVNVTFDDNRTVLCKDNKYSFDGINYENSSSFKIPFTVTIANRANGVDKDILSTVTDGALSIKVDQLTIDQPDGFNFDWSGSGQVNIPNELILPIGETWSGNGFLRPELFWVPEWQTEISLDCVAKVNGQDHKTSSTFRINNLDKDPVYSNDTRNAIKQFVEQSLKQDVIKKPMGSFFSEEQRQQLNVVLSTWLTVIKSPNIDDKVKRSLYETYTKDGIQVRSSIIVPVVINNLQHKNVGKRDIRFTVTLDDYGSSLNDMLQKVFQNNDLTGLTAEVNTIKWEIIDKRGLSNGITSGYVQVEAKADLDALENVLNKATKQAKKEFQKAVEDAFSEVDLLSMLKNDLIGEVVNSMLSTGDLTLQTVLSPYVVSMIKETISGIIWQEKIDIKGTVDSTTKSIQDSFYKKIAIRCPVDVYLYYGNELKGVIKDDQISEEYALLTVGSYMEIQGTDEKIIYLPDDDFSIRLIGTAAGSMDYIIEEYEDGYNGEKLIRTVYFDDLPLWKGKVYTGRLEEGIKKDKSVYALSTDEGKIEADLDTLIGDKITSDSVYGDTGTTNQGQVDRDRNENSNSNKKGARSGNGSGNSSQTNDLNDKGSWQKDHIGWWYKRIDGSWPADGWCQLFYNGKMDWYYFAPSGYMVTGWIMDDGHWYYLYPISDGSQGKMLTGWQFIDGKWYYFNEISNGTKGALLVDTWINGYHVDKNGVWVN